jgi:hypothetical protein
MHCCFVPRLYILSSPCGSDLEPPVARSCPLRSVAAHLFQEVSGPETLLRYSLAVLDVGEVFPCCMMLLRMIRRTQRTLASSSSSYAYQSGD